MGKDFQFLKVRSEINPKPVNCLHRPKTVVKTNSQSIQAIIWGSAFKSQKLAESLAQQGFKASALIQ